MSFSENCNALLNAYYEIERQFIELLRIIPIDNHPNTHSPRLYDILQSSCSQTVNLLKHICDELKLNYESKDFPNYYKVLNQTGILTRQLVDVSQGNLAYWPFVLAKDAETPDWWTAYNKTKHDLPKGYEKGSLRNTISAMTGIFALHNIAVYAQNFGKEILNNKQWNEEDATALNTLIPSRAFTEPLMEGVPRSSIFYCASYFRTLGGL